jgi:hypothetical protein
VKQGALGFPATCVLLPLLTSLGWLSGHLSPPHLRGSEVENVADSCSEGTPGTEQRLLRGVRKGHPSKEGSLLHNWGVSSVLDSAARQRE